jgi:O-acetyl-ADP-ribose deacetylase (regulator of RNase III)
MALETKHGDLFANIVPPCIVVHGVNAQGKMNSGFAGQLRKRFPDAYKIYKKAQGIHGLTLGDINGYTDDEIGLTIVNAITQDRYGRDKEVVYVDYEAVEKAMNTVARLAHMRGNLPVLLPFIGGGLANGNRDKLLEIFNRAFADTNATLWLDTPAVGIEERN